MPPPESTAAATLTQMRMLHDNWSESDVYDRVLAQTQQMMASAPEAKSPMSYVSATSTPTPNSGAGWTAVVVKLPPEAAAAQERAGMGQQSFPTFSGMSVVPAFDGELWSVSLVSAGDMWCVTFDDTREFAYRAVPGQCSAADVSRAFAVQKDMFVGG